MNLFSRSPTSSCISSPSSCLSSPSSKSSNDDISISYVSPVSDGEEDCFDCDECDLEKISSRLPKSNSWSFNLSLQT